MRRVSAAGYQCSEPTAHRAPWRHRGAHAHDPVSSGPRPSQRDSDARLSRTRALNSGRSVTYSTEAALDSATVWARATAERSTRRILAWGMEGVPGVGVIGEQTNGWYWTTGRYPGVHTQTADCEGWGRGGKKSWELASARSFFVWERSPATVATPHPPSAQGSNHRVGLVPRVTTPMISPTQRGLPMRTTHAILHSIQHSVMPGTKTRGTRVNEQFMHLQV